MPYLDHAATTPMLPEAISAVTDALGQVGNPSSLHGAGRVARRRIEESRELLAAALGARPSEVILTAGGTESDNLAVKGVAAARSGGHIVTSTIEHHAVLRTCQALEQQGFTVTYVPVDGHGLVDPDDVRRAVRPETILVTIMHANSEVGTVQPIAEIGRITRERGIPFHVDGVQTFGKLPLDLDALGVDLLSFSSHKIYGPKGVAGLCVRRGTKMASVQHGGEHERRRRAGTENVAGIVGFGKAVELRARDMAAEAVRLTALRDRLWEGVSARVPEVRLNGHPTRRLPGTCNISFHRVESESIVLGLDLKGVGVSAGSACTSGNVEPSYVLVAMGVPIPWAMGAVRCSLGRGTSAEDIDYVVDAVEPLVAKLRSASPARV